MKRNTHSKGKKMKRLLYMLLFALSFSASADQGMVSFDLLTGKISSVEACSDSACAGYDINHGVLYVAKQDISRNVRVAAGIGWQVRSRSMVGVAFGAVSDTESTVELSARTLLLPDGVAAAYGVGIRLIDRQAAPATTPTATPPRPPLLCPPPHNHPPDEHGRCL